MPSRKTFALSVVLMQLLWAGAASAALYPQPPAVSGFTMTGFIQAMTLDNPADVLSGGTITVNGTKVIVPRNTIVILSASNVSWQELWAYAPCPWGLPLGAGPAGQALPVGACATGGNGATGLALADVYVDPSTGARTVPLTTHEVTLVGNRIGNGTADPDYVAGLVSMAQQALNLGAGIVNYIDYATGTVHVGGPMGAPSARDTLVQINDPVGRFGRVMSPDPRWTADTDNPTIHSKTAYPMCIPRAVPPVAVVPGAVAPPETDPLCPQRNRPLDPVSLSSPLGNFTLCNPGAYAAGACRANTPPIVLGGVNAQATVVPDSDATQQAPFMPGDAIEWSGTLQVDRDGSLTGTGVANQPYVSAWNIVANVGIYTSPGATPAYVNVEDSLLGVGGSAITAPVPVPQEVTTRIKAVGFFSDPQRQVDLFAVEVDPCTGVETEALMLVAIPNKAGGVPWGRFRDVDQAGLFPITRQWRVRYHPIFSDPPGDLVAANGLKTMQFTLPVGEFIFPENTVYGDPTLLVVPNNLQDFPFLVQGEGPWRGDPLKVVGQLTPFPLTDSIPGLTPPAPSPFACPAAGAPSAIVTPPNQTVPTNAPSVTLDASSSHSNPVGDALGFQWIQTSGPAVAIADPFSARTTFRPPDVKVNTGLGFDVVVTDLLTGAVSTATTLVIVTPFQVRADIVVITSALYKANRGVLAVNATSSDQTCAALLTIQAIASNGATLLPPNTFMQVSNIVAGGCAYTYQSGKAIFPPAGTTLAKVTVVSSEGGSDVCPNGGGCFVVVK